MNVDVEIDSRDATLRGLVRSAFAPAAFARAVAVSADHLLLAEDGVAEQGVGGAGHFG